MFKGLLFLSAVALANASAFGADKVTELSWHYGAEPSTVTSYGSAKGYTDYGFIYVDADLATRLAGTKVNGIKMVSGVYSALLVKATFMLTESLDSTPFFSTNDKLNLSKRDITTGDITWNSNEYTFNEPYVIKAGQGFYVGLVYEEKSSTGNPFAIDNNPTESYTGGFVGARVTSDTDIKDVKLKDLTSQVGALGVYLNLSGDNIPQQDVMLTDITKTANVVKPGETYTAKVSFVNRGAQSVSSLTYKYKNGNSAEQTGTFKVIPNVNFGRTGTFYLTLTAGDTGLNDEVVEVVKVNDATDENSADNKATGRIVVFSGKSSNVFKRNVYGEEYTGTWCGWCPYGYVGMEYMRDTYTDGSWVGVAIHQGDEMQSSDFYDIYSKISGYPSGKIERGELISPDQETLESEYKTTVANGSPAEIELSACHDDNTVYVTTKTKFKFDIEPGDFTYEYILREDNVGPYNQYNNYAGGQYGTMEGFEKLSSPTPLTYNDVARARVVYSQPFTESVKANTTVTHRGQITIPAGVKIDDTAVIALLVGPNSYIANSKLAKEYAAVNDITVDPTDDFVPVVNNGTLSVGDTDAEVYSISGQHVATLRGGATANLAAGLYIVRSGDKVAKVLVK
jgi:hypothetical protein